MPFSPRGSKRAYELLKRVGDVVAAAAAILVLSPVMIATSIAVRVDLGSPVLCRQPRPGRRGEIFEIYKFRTMREPDPERGLVSDEQRLTKVGMVLRATSLDELPELLNVLRGDMSLVGPRPLRVRYLERYSQEQSRRHEVRPGITGLAQISGRNAVGWDDRLALDVEYVARRSLALDLRILLATVPKVLRSEGVSEEGASSRLTSGVRAGSRSTSSVPWVPASGSWWI